MLGEIILCEQLMHEEVRVVLIHLDLFVDHFFLALDITRIETRVKYKITENGEGFIEVAVKYLALKTDCLFSRESLHIAAQGIHLTGDLCGGAVLSTFKEHMFDEMCDAIEFFALT